MGMGRVDSEVMVATEGRMDNVGSSDMVRSFCDSRKGFEAWTRWKCPVGLWAKMVLRSWNTRCREWAGRGED